MSKKCKMFYLISATVSLYRFCTISYKFDHRVCSIHDVFGDFSSCSRSETKQDSSILSPLGTQRASKLKSTYLGTFSERFEQFCFGSVFWGNTEPKRTEPKIPKHRFSVRFGRSLLLNIFIHCMCIHFDQLWLITQHFIIERPFKSDISLACNYESNR